MRAILVKDATLVVSEVEKPTPKESEVLIEIKAIGLNRADLLQRKGTYPSPKGWPEWPGLEVAGVIAEVGSSVTNYKIGDRVCALVGGGGYAEYICVTPSRI